MLINEEVAAWIAGMDELFARVAGRFARIEPRRRARAYVRGLLAPLAGKNGWTLAEAAGETTADGMQRLLNSATWDAAGIRDDLREYAVTHLGRDGVLVVDDTAFRKRGCKSAGVQRQHSGDNGRAENCQLGVFAAYATSKGHTLIDRELYLPESWTADHDRRRAARIPDRVEFATRSVLARRMLERSLNAGVPASWVTADEVYGQDPVFREWLEKRRVSYVVAVPHSLCLPLTGGASRADVLVAQAPTEAWKIHTCDDGDPGPDDWAVATVIIENDTIPVGWSRWLLARRSPARNHRGDRELTYYLSCAPRATIDEDLVRVARTWPVIEDCFRIARTKAGLDDYQVRHYDAWYRHITLAMLAHTYLAVTAAVDPKVLAGPSSRLAQSRSSIVWHT